MAGELERELHARRIFCKALVDAELEEEGAILMAQHDAGGHRCRAGAQRDDLALRGLCQRGNRAANEGRIARILDQRGAALAFPAAGLELQECFERRPDLVGLARDLEGDRPVLFEAMALATQLLELFGAERLMQQRFTILRRVEAGADVGAEDARLQAVAIENVA